MWFSMVERSFDASGVSTENTKFGYILGAVNPQYAAEVRDIILDPPLAEPYQKLKTELIRRLSSSQEQKTRRLLEHEEIGDRKPSQFLRRSVLRTLWLGRLPSHMQVIVATQKYTDLDKVADLADAIADATGPRGQVAEAAYPRGQALETPYSRSQVAESSSARGSFTDTTPAMGHDYEALLNLKLAQLTLSFQQEIAALRQ
ncbi:uncharacterized protein LOC108627532, partial [Ceratina calcarata]|uniref:Uncharacterized protein LOC108627532 n=1 Tax=Ceratina calcarata TaxID=156304 RepID=A0AAJ7N9I6_9HYME